MELTITDGSDRKITLPEQMFWELMRNKEAINASFNDITQKKDTFYQLHLGGNFYVNLKSPYWIVHITRWKHSLQGRQTKAESISLYVNEWKQVYNQLAKMNFPEFVNYVPCYLQNDHCNPLGMLMCHICSPNTMSFDY